MHKALGVLLLLRDGEHIVPRGYSVCDPGRPSQLQQKGPPSPRSGRLRKETNHATYRPGLRSNCRHMCKGQGNLFCQLRALLLGD